MGYEVLAPQGQFHGKVFAFPARVYYFMVKNLNIEYFAPAILDDLLSVTCEVINLTGARLEMKQEIYCQDKLLVSLSVQLAHVSFSRKRPIRIPEALVNKIESL